ncbi:sulfurtransferase TusA family protein [Nocardioides islandensis]|jgi:TusA-related sulfurtransferase|uniref:Sulfurtransferase TusA family protein n=1 Tax=Nocardioides islandensis TaxID=433663 RepID=A0A930VG91_9ACTN|nr:sulfurtransferase TusA family protein [Nocardioides islandensis]MBF4766038.1 sulfurtransferase TusA family protein [Nocardioides islandensis]
MELELDCRGQVCPLPVISLAKAAETLQPGDTVVVTADDAAAAVDIPAWCRMKGHEYLGSEEPSVYRVRLR